MKESDLPVTGLTVLVSLVLFVLKLKDKVLLEWVEVIGVIGVCVGVAILFDILIFYLFVRRTKDNDTPSA